MTPQQRQQAILNQMMLYKKLRRRLRFAVTDSEQKVIKGKITGLQVSSEVVLDTVQDLTPEQKEMLTVIKTNGKPCLSM
jgi:CBS-domain-containing membrane protein